METEVLFEEKQYLGHNRFSIVVRTLLSLFCFIAYYLSQNPGLVGLSFKKIVLYPVGEMNSALIFFFIGIAILVLSAAFTFVLHIQTTVYNGYIILDGFWTSRKVKIDLNGITEIRKGKYKKNIFRRSAYNLHNKGIIRFYTSGEDFIELLDSSGFTYKIGSQKNIELYNSIKNQLQKTN